MRRRESGPGELEALDPLTGESLSRSFPTSPSPAGAPGRGGRRPEVRASRLRRVRFVFGVLALICAGSAAYFGVTISQLRAVERTWREAIALDRSRASADVAVLQAIEDSGAGDDAAEERLAIIGDEAVASLARAERSLASRRILDSKVSSLRDQMIEALEFRRFQTTPQRRQMGSTPLQQVDFAIDVQLSRWGLRPTSPPQPTIRSLRGVLDELGRFTDEPLGATLFVADARTLITVDVDGSLARGRAVDGPIVRLLPAPGGAAVSNGAELVVYPADVDAPAIVRVPANGPVFEVADGTGDLWVVEQETIVRRFRPAAGEALQAPTTLPPRRRVVGGAAGRLVLQRTDAGTLELWTPPTATASESTVPLTTAFARFLAGDTERVLWQGPLPFADFGGDGYLHSLEIDSGERELIALPPTDAVSGAYAPDGTFAIIAGPPAGRLGRILVAAAGTSALAGTNSPGSLVRENSLRWSPDGAHLFWLTIDGRIAYRSGTDRDAPSTTLRAGLDGLDRLTVMGR